jgi:hypothetical protein
MDLSVEKRYLQKDHFKIEVFQLNDKSYMIRILDRRGFLHGIPARGLTREKALELFKPIKDAFLFGIHAHQMIVDEVHVTVDDDEGNINEYPKRTRTQQNAGPRQKGRVSRK